MSVAAWFPYHFVQPDLDPFKFFQLPQEALGIDSMGMFYITHGDTAFAQAARVQPFINNLFISTHLLEPETSPSWQHEYIKEGKDKKRYFFEILPGHGLSRVTFL